MKNKDLALQNVVALNPNKARNIRNAGLFVIDNPTFSLNELCQAIGVPKNLINRTLTNLKVMGFKFERQPLSHSHGELSYTCIEFTPVRSFAGRSNAVKAIRAMSAKKRVLKFTAQYAMDNEGFTFEDIATQAECQKSAIWSAIKTLEDTYGFVFKRHQPEAKSEPLYLMLVKCEFSGVKMDPAKTIANQEKLPFLQRYKNCGFRKPQTINPLLAMVLGIRG